MSEFIFVHLLDDRPVGADLGLTIPPHVTLLHWFETKHSPDEIFSAAEAALMNCKSVETYSTGADLFGSDKDIPVMRLERTPELLDLHLRLVDCLDGVGAVFDRTWVGATNWRPHVTNTQDRELPAGLDLLINNLSFIEKRQPDKHRIILGKLALDSSK